MEITKLGIFMGIIIAAGITTIYGVAYQHELKNVAIAKQYGLNSTMNFYLPYTYSQSAYWQGQPNKTVYSIASTGENAIEIDKLASNNPSAYNAMNAKFFANESTQAQNSGANWFLIPFTAFCLITLYAFWLSE